MQLTKKIEIRSNFKLYLLVFSFFLLLNFATSGGHPYAIDDVQYFLHTENLVLHGSFMLDLNSTNAYRLMGEKSIRDTQHVDYELENKKWTSDMPIVPFYDYTPILLPLITTPLYYFSLVTHSDPVGVLDFFTNSIILSFSSLMIFIVSLHYFNSRKISFVLSLAFLTTTFVWSYNTGMMLQPLTSLMIISWFYFTITSTKESRYRPLLSGIFLGFSLLSQGSTVILLPGLAIYTMLRFYKFRKNLFLFIFTFVFLLIIQAALNEIRFDSLTDFGYGPQQKLSYYSHVDGLIGYIFGLGWGLPFNAPLVLLLPFSLYLISKKHKDLAVMIVYCTVITWIFYGTQPSPHWSGYGCWGSRYFLPILPLLIVSLGFLFSEYKNSRIFKVSFTTLATIGFSVGILGKLVWYMYGFTYGWNVYKLNLIKNWFDLQNYNLQYLPVTLNILTIKTGYPAKLVGHAFGPQSWGLTPCTYDLFIFCKFGFATLFVMIVSLVILLFILFKYFLSTPNSNLKNNFSHDVNFQPFERLWSMRSTILQFALINLKIRFQNTYLGLLWGALEPLLYFIVLYVVFTSIRVRTEEYYPIYLISGIMFFQIFSRGTSGGVISLTSNGSILKTLNINKEFFPLVSTVAIGILSVIDLLVFFVMMPIFHFVPSFTIALLPIPLFLLMILIMGISYLLSIANVYAKDIQHVWMIFTYALLFVTPIFWYVKDAKPILLLIQSVNPLGQLIEIVHKLTVLNTVPSINEWTYTALFIITIYIIGWIVFRTQKQKIVEEL